MSPELTDAIEAAANDLSESIVWMFDQVNNPEAERPTQTRPDVALMQQAISRGFAALFLLAEEAE